MLALPVAAMAQSSGDAALAATTWSTTSGCHDCHTPFIMGPNGPEPDMTRALSGHPQDIVIDAPAQLPEPWIGAMNATNTAWSGPWGVSFTANLTPDPETGIWREMTEEQFIEALRTGRHLGQGRPILPPMPWPVYGTEDRRRPEGDLRLPSDDPAVKNKVPDPLPPAQ